MHASPGREVQAIFLHGREFAPLLTAEALEAGSQDLGDLVEALGGGHEVRRQCVRASQAAVGIIASTARLHGHAAAAFC
jgi:hypothetical protein